MTVSPTAFWRLMKPEQTIHPLDRPILERANHTFRLSEPPPAFIGDIEHAPVIVLCSNGGWNIQTPQEFLHRDNSPAKFVARLHTSQACDPAIVSPYYGRSNLAAFISCGEVALLNLSPYRSPELSKEPENATLAHELVSSKYAVRWVKDILMPLVRNGERMIFLKRNTWLKFLEPQYHRYLNGTLHRGPHVYVRDVIEIRNFVASISHEPLAKFAARANFGVADGRDVDCVRRGSSWAARGGTVDLRSARARRT